MVTGSIMLNTILSVLEWIVQVVIQSANFSVPYSYNKICGQLRGFQKGSPDSFYPHAFAHNITPPDGYVPDKL